jgi:hypothetical protein
MNFKIGQLKGEIQKAKGLLMLAMHKEEILGQNNRGLVEKNFGLKKALKFFENYFYRSMKGGRGGGGGGGRGSLVGSLTDVWLGLQSRYRQEARWEEKGGKGGKFQIGTSYELFNSIQEVSGMALGWTPFESPKNNEFPNLFAKDPTGTKDFNMDFSMMNRALQNAPKTRVHQTPQSPNLDSLIMDCQSVQRNVQFRKRSFINSYLESQDGIFMPSPPMTAADYGFKPMSKQNVDNILEDDSSEKDLRFDVPLSGELIIDPDADD